MSTYTLADKWCSCLWGLSKSLALSVCWDFFWEWNRTPDGFASRESYHLSSEVTVRSLASWQSWPTVWNAQEYTGEALKTLSQLPAQHLACPQRSPSQHIQKELPVFPSPYPQTCGARALPYSSFDNSPSSGWSKTLEITLTPLCLLLLNNTSGSTIDSTVRTYPDSTASHHLQHYGPPSPSSSVAGNTAIPLTVLVASTFASVQSQQSSSSNTLKI